MYYAIAWVVLLIAFGVLEGMTAGMVSIWFCVGTIPAIICSVMGQSLSVQIAVFAICSLLGMAVLRPFAKRFLWKNRKMEKTNAERILEKEAIVTESINNQAAVGQVQVQGEYWTARGATEQEIAAGSVVRVLRIEGVKAIVERV